MSGSPTRSVANQRSGFAYRLHKIPSFNDHAMTNMCPQPDPVTVWRLSAHGASYDATQITAPGDLATNPRCENWSLSVLFVPGGGNGMGLEQRHCQHSSLKN